MSFEGWYQLICKRGHSTSVDCYDMDDKTKCALCEAPVVWTNLVDVTNGSWAEDGKRIDGYIELEVLRQAEICKCRTCGEEHVKKNDITTVKIPE